MRRFQNFKKANSVNLSQISLLKMWLLVPISELNIDYFFKMANFDGWTLATSELILLEFMIFWVLSFCIFELILTIFFFVWIIKGFITGFFFDCRQFSQISGGYFNPWDLSYWSLSHINSLLLETFCASFLSFTSNKFHVLRNHANNKKVMVCDIKWPWNN